MDELGGLLAERMDPEQSHVAAPENELQEAVCVTNNPAAGGGIVRTSSNYVGHSFLLQRLLGLADHTGLRDGVDPGGENEQSLQQKGVPYVVGRRSYDASPRG